MLVLHTNEKLKIIRKIYTEHQKKFNYTEPPTKDNDLFILVTCMTNEYINNWINDMQQHPPKVYPLDMYFLPSHNVWIDLYYRNGNNKRISTADRNFFKPHKYVYVAQQWADLI